MTLIPDGRLIIFNYPAGAGGKMLQNCVGLSRNCVLTYLDYAVWQMNYVGEYNSNFYQQKLNWILETLPPKEQIGQWLSFEFGERNLYGINFLDFHKLAPVPNQEIYQLAKHNLWSTLTVHNFGSVEYYYHYWPTIKHVCLTNSTQFAKKSLAVKNKELKFDNNWVVDGFTPPDISFNFSIDDCIYNREKFLNQVEELYNYLEFDDFQKNLVAEYYNRYILLHL